MKPLISSFVMGAVVILAYKGLYAVIGSNSISTMIAIVIGVIVYGLMIIRTKTISRDEMTGISAGRKLAAICDKLKLW